MTEKESLEEKVIEEDPEFKKDRTVTQVLINTSNIIDNADGQVLSALYGPINYSLNIGTERLGAITTARALFQAVSSPFWGWLSDRFSRKLLLAIGCGIWGVFTIVLAFLNSFWGMFFVRALTGIGLAVIFPTAQSLISDFFPKAKRGKAFGMLGLTTVLGAIIGTLYATILGGSEEEPVFIGSFEGWRVVFITIGGFSLILGLLVFIFGRDPKRGMLEEYRKKSSEEQQKHTTTWKDYKKILSNRTFVLIVLQGVAGTIPWNAIFFVVYWLEEMGIGAFQAGIAFSTVAIGAAFGNLFGGFIGDWAAKRNPNNGRLIVAQISVFSGIPMMVVLFFVIPRFVLGTLSLNTLLILFVILGVITGFLISWSAPATNNPIFSELFKPEIRSSAFAIDRLFEGSIAAAGTYLVALIANRIFGYSELPAAKGTLSNILAMSNALLLTTIIPWAICLFVYTFVYFTYPKDRDTAVQEMKEDYLKSYGEAVAFDLYDEEQEAEEQEAEEQEAEEQKKQSGEK